MKAKELLHNPPRSSGLQSGRPWEQRVLKQLLNDEG
jgi:hypothetical protein